MATGRWIIHHTDSYTDILSYTGAGKPWIYPVALAVLFYLLHQLGGYPLLSWVSAAACVGTVALLIGRDAINKLPCADCGPAGCVTHCPRAELFTELLFALFVSVLWRYQRAWTEKCSGCSAMHVLVGEPAPGIRVRVGHVRGVRFYRS